MTDSPFKLPIRPGRVSSDELLALMVNPSSQVQVDNVDLDAVTPYTVVPMANREIIIISIQSSGDVWINFNGAPAAIGSGLKVIGGTLMGLGLAGSVGLSLISGAGTVSVCIVQAGDPLTYGGSE